MSGDVLVLVSRIDCDIAFADPPYEFTDWPRLLDRLRAGLLVAEATTGLESTAGWEQRRVKRYGRTWVTFLERSGGP
jgi:16S rRNA (guanine966-N2)-methyltransferase